MWLLVDSNTTISGVFTSVGLPPWIYLDYTIDPTDVWAVIDLEEWDLYFDVPIGPP
jgi:hypothetical protein